MREEFNLLNIFCATQTVTAAETMSIGLPADPAFGEGRRSGALFFACHLDYFILTTNFTSIYRDLVLFRQFHHDKKLSSIYRDWQKTRHRDADGT